MSEDEGGELSASDIPVSREDQLAQLQDEHAQLEHQISALLAQGGNDLQVMTLKRQKLRVKDKIAWLNDDSTPDIIA